MESNVLFVEITQHQKIIFQNGLRMKSKVLIFLSLLLFCSCQNKESHLYDFDNQFYSDHINYYLLQDVFLIDSSKYYNDVYVVTERTPYDFLNIDICKNGWSCRSYSEIVKYNKTYLDGRFNYENKFLNKIIEIENLKLKDSIKILDYWKKFNLRSLKISYEPNWNEIVDLFYYNIVFNTTESNGCFTRLDRCELQMYKNILNDLKEKKAGIYYATTWLPKYLSENARIKYIFDVKRLKLINNDGKVNVEISAGDYLKFR